MITPQKPANDQPQNDKNSLWAQWAADAQAGDKKAYNNLLRDIVPYIRGVLAPSLANPDWVDDITQNVLMSVHKSLHTYSADRPFSPWLRAIISFRKTDFLRSYYSKQGNKSVDLENLEFQKKHVTNTEYSGELKDVEKALEHLPDTQRLIFQRMKIEGYTAKEVAQEMDMSVSAVKVSVHRSMKKLKGILSDHE